MSFGESSGNKLNVDRSRSTMVVNFSFLELGQESMSNGTAWLTPICVRTNVIGEVEGGWPHMFKLFLNSLLVGPTGLSTGGVAIDVNGRPTLVFAKLAAVLADGDGHMKCWDWKGAASLKPCFKHFNIFKKAIVRRNRVEHSWQCRSVFSLISGS